MVRSGSSDSYIYGFFNSNRFRYRSVFRIDFDGVYLCDMFGGDLFHRIGNLSDWVFLHDKLIVNYPSLTEGASYEYDSLMGMPVLRRLPTNS